MSYRLIGHQGAKIAQVGRCSPSFAPCIGSLVSPARLLQGPWTAIWSGTQRMPAHQAPCFICFSTGLELPLDPAQIMGQLSPEDPRSYSERHYPTVQPSGFLSRIRGHLSMAPRRYSMEAPVMELSGPGVRRFQAWIRLPTEDSQPLR